jgi:hypothetical protein
VKVTLLTTKSFQCRIYPGRTAKRTGRQLMRGRWRRRRQQQRLQSEAQHSLERPRKLRWDPSPHRKHPQRPSIVAPPRQPRAGRRERIRW